MARSVSFVEGRVEFDLHVVIIEDQCRVPASTMYAATAIQKAYGLTSGIKTNTPMTETVAMIREIANPKCIANPSQHRERSLFGDDYNHPVSIRRPGDDPLPGVVHRWGDTPGRRSRVSQRLRRMKVDPRALLVLDFGKP